MSVAITYKIPPTQHIGSYGTVGRGATTEEAYADALWDYNKCRAHEGQPPLEELPDGTTSKVLEPLLTPTEEILEIGERLAADENKNDHFTAEPMFCLQILIRDVGFDTVFNDTKCWFNPEKMETVYDDDDEVVRHEVDGWLLDESGGVTYLEEEDTGWDGPYGYQDRWEAVMVAFTEKGLEDYMRADGHNVRARAFRGKTRVFVESFNRCREMTEIRKHLMQLS